MIPLPCPPLLSPPGRCPLYCPTQLFQLPSKYKKTGDADPEEIPLEEAIVLIQDKRAREALDGGGGGGGGHGGRAGSKKKTKSASAGAKKKKNSGSDGRGKSKRPLSGFFMFSKESREAYAAGEAGGEGAGPALKAKDLSERWKALSEERRAEYNVASAAALEEWKAGNAEGSAPSSTSSSSSGGRKKRAPLRTASFSSSASRGKNAPGSKDGKDNSERPKSAYILFTSERRPQLKAEHGYPPAVMMSKLAEEWREMEGSPDREVYVRRAAEMKEQWLTA